jgi:hypothetical protein
MVNQGDVADRLRLEIETMLREYPELADDDVLRADMLEGATDIRDVLVSLTDTLGTTKALGVGLHDYISELSGRAERYEHRQEFLRDLIFRIMDSAQLKKLELSHATLSLKNNPPRLVGDADPATLPDDLCAIKRSVDRKAVRAALEAGKEIPGFVLSNAAPSLTVRVK